MAFLRGVLAAVTALAGVWPAMAAPQGIVSADRDCV
jgi:hypothetical protein